MSQRKSSTLAQTANGKGSSRFVLPASMMNR